MSTIDDALALAAAAGLRLTAEGATAEEAGLDYRVVMAADAGGRRWVVRVARRADVSTGMAAEARVLDLVAPVLAADGIAVPDWRVRTPDLVAYPALPGSPGLTVVDGEPVWHTDPADPDYAARLGRLLARLHGIGPDDAAAAGVEARTPEQVRSSWQDDVDRVCDAFAVAPEREASLRAWLADDACWPDETVMTHGEIYQAHVLTDDDGAVTGVLDWTTARVDDPARDFVTQYGAAGDAGLDLALAAYEDAGGRVGAGLAAQARRLWDAAPLGYALHALTTGAPQDHEAAARMLDPVP